MPTVPAETIAGRYRVEGEIARGGMGAVLLAEDLVLNRKVAVKRLHPHLTSDPAMAERFKQEALSAASLTHTGIVTVFDAGDDEQGAFLVMELVEGETLADRIARGPVEPEDVARMGAEVARALDHAHERGIVHRDVKPGNVMLLPDGRAKIADFGIAKALEGSSTHTSTGTVLGTASYISPEQATGQAASPASDVYALGTVLYETVAGHKPFEGETALAVALAHQSEDPPPLPDHVPDSLRSVIERAMVKNPTMRFETAGDMAAALEAVAGGGTAIVPMADPTGELPATEAIAADDTMMLAGEGRARRGWPLVVGVLVTLVLLALLFTVLLPVLGGPDPEPAEGRPSPRVSLTPSTTAPTVDTPSPTPTTPAPTTSPPPTTPPPTTPPPTTPPPTTPPPTTAPPTTAPPSPSAEAPSPGG